jgi:hypothetical protein
VPALEDASKVVDNEALRLFEMRHDTGEFGKSKSIGVSSASHLAVRLR